MNYQAKSKITAGILTQIGDRLHHKHQHDKTYECFETMPSKLNTHDVLLSILITTSDTKAFHFNVMNQCNAC